MVEFCTFFYHLKDAFVKILFTSFLSCLSLVLSAQTISTIAGTGVWACSGINGPAISAGVGQAYAVVTDAGGNVYVSASTCRKVLKINSAGVITAYAGNGSGGATGDGGPATDATLGTPTALAMDKYGNLYIADGEESVIRKVNNAGIISTIAGNAAVIGGGYSGDGGPAVAALIQSPEGIAVDTLGNVYIADNGNNMIRKISTSGIITRVAGNGTYSYSGDGGPALAAGVQSPGRLAIDYRGNIYVSAEWNSRVRKISPSGIITCFAGNGTNGNSGDGGPATAACIAIPGGIATDTYGNIFFTDWRSNVIRKVDANNIISTYAGDGFGAHSGDGGPAYLAQVNCPYDIVIDRDGYKYIAELNGAYVRKVDTCLAPVLTPILGRTVMCSSDTIALSDSTAGGNWSVSNTTLATIDASGHVAGVSHGLVSVSYTKCNGCATISQVRQVVVGPFAGTISEYGRSPGASGMDTICYDGFLTTSGEPGGVWGVTNSTSARISATGYVTPMHYWAADTAFYAVTDSCGADTAYYPFVIVWCPDAVGEMKEKAGSWDIFPNPTSGKLQVVSEAKIENLEIVDMYGRRVFSVQSINKEISIDVSALPPGVYLMKVGNDLQKKFAKY